jgi:hypothetical protein
MCGVCRYYVDASYREAVAVAWEGLPLKQRSHVMSFLSRLGYHEDVHVDEWQAYHSTEKSNFWGMNLDAALPT